MIIALDTSFLVAALIESHAKHDETIPWTTAFSDNRHEAVFCTHAGAEVWSVLTRLPGSMKLAPATATLIVERLFETYRPLPLTAEGYTTAMRRCAERSVVSGGLFDALHLVAAEAASADVMITSNVGDFVRLSSDGAPPIVDPGDSSAINDYL